MAAVSTDAGTAHDVSKASLDPNDDPTTRVSWETYAFNGQLDSAYSQGTSTGEAPSKRTRRHPEGESSIPVSTVQNETSCGKHTPSAQTQDSNRDPKSSKRNRGPCSKLSAKRARTVPTPVTNVRVQHSIRELLGCEHASSSKCSGVSCPAGESLGPVDVISDEDVSEDSSRPCGDKIRNPGSTHIESEHNCTATAGSSGLAHQDTTKTPSSPDSSKLVLERQSDVPLPLLWARSIRRCGRRPKSMQHDPTRPLEQLNASFKYSLNQMQKTAATSDVNTPLAIVAGAGTGKTTTLLCRVDHLVRSGALPKNILLLTFTNNSADDICDRLAGALGHQVAHDVVCTTIHSFCLALLRCFGSRIGLGGRVRAAEKNTLRRFLAEAWPWSGLEKERKMCAKSLKLDTLLRKRWSDIFSAFRKQHPDAFQQCLLTPVLDAGAARRAAVREPRAVETEAPLTSLRDALLHAPLVLRNGEFHYGFFFFGVSGESDDGRCWWAAPKAFKFKSQNGNRIPKGAVLQSAAYTDCDRTTWYSISVTSGTNMLAAIEKVLSEIPAAHVWMKFQVPHPPPKGSPAALRTKEDARWRQLLAKAVFFQLTSQSDGEHQCRDEEARKKEMRTLCQAPKRRQLTDLLKRIELAKRDGTSPEDFAQTEEPGDMAYCWAFCEERMRQDGLVDFQDMLRMSSQLLQNDDVRNIVNAQQRHVLVDEFQDVSQPQLEVLKALFDKAVGRSLCVVGDDDQTIYTWNGSTTKIFDMLQEHCCQRLQLVQLTENYRSSHRILQVGHLALTHNTNRIPKALQACASWANDEMKCPPPLLWECGTTEDEAAAIADEIQVLLGKAKGDSMHFVEEARPSPCHHPNQIAVLFRCFNFKGKVHHALVHQLVKRQIPYYVVRESPFWEQSFALDLLAYLRLVVCDSDDESFARALSRPPRGCGKGVLDRLRERQQQVMDGLSASSPTPSLEQVACQLVHSQSSQSEEAIPRALSGRAFDGLRDFVDLVARLRIECALLRVDEALETVAIRSGYAEWFDKERKKQKRRSNTHLTAGEEQEEDDEDESSEEGSEADQEPVLDENVNGDEDLADEELPDVKLEEGLKQPVEASNDEPQVHGKIAEAVELACCFADRWESPFGSRTLCDENCKVPSLFAICGQRLLEIAKDSPTKQREIVHSLPELVLDQLTADCGSCGRVQVEDFIAKTVLDPKDTAGVSGSARNSKRKKNRGPARGVCISTIHAAKGLEWPVVFVAHWNEGFLPMAPSPVVELNMNGRRTKREPTEAEAAEHQEEERRLAHVAVTRAQQRLTLTHVRSFSARRKDAAKISSLPLPEPQLQEGMPNAAVWTRVSPKSEVELQWETQEDDASWHLG